MSNSLVTIKTEENVATLYLDDGKANALGYEVIDALLAALSEEQA